MKTSFTVVLEKETEGGYTVFVPALPGCHTQGDSRDEALANAKEAIEAYLESLKLGGEPLPTPTEEIVQHVTVSV